MGLDQSQQWVDNEWIKTLVEVCPAEKVPCVHHEVHQPEPQERRGGNVAVRAGNGLVGWCGGEGRCLVTCRLNHRRDWVITELITAEHRPRLVATNAGQEQGGEAIADHHMLNQLTH
jgi:hypothetical protein